MKVEKIRRKKFYRYAQISGEKIIGYFFKIRGRRLFIHNGRQWRTVTKIFADNGGGKNGETRTTN